MNLVADIGGTHARFALCSEASAVTQAQNLRTVDFKNLGDALLAYLQTARTEATGDPVLGISKAVISIAAGLAGDRVKMTNADWDFSIQQTQEDLAQKIGIKSLRVINDFEALALAVPTLQANELNAIGHSMPLDTIQTKAILGPGTGLGMAGVAPLVVSPSKWQAIPCEGGHASFAPSTAREAALLQAAWTITSRHICWEDFLSGMGLPLLHQSVCAVDGFAYTPLTPAEITQAALMGDDAACLVTLNTFCELLGSAAGDLALMVGARGGVYIKGGVLDRVLEAAPDFLQRSRFRVCFEAKGAYNAYLKTIPTWFITAQQLALRGCATLL